MSLATKGTIREDLAHIFNASGIAVICDDYLRATGRADSWPDLYLEGIPDEEIVNAFLDVFETGAPAHEACEAVLALGKQPEGRE